MANCYDVSLAIRGKKEVLDEIQNLFQKELDEGQTNADYYTMHKTLRRMGYDPDKLEWRAYTSNVERPADDKLFIDYTGAWSAKPQVIIAIREKWQVEIEWEGVDEFGQYPETTKEELVGKYKLEDEEEGLNPFCRLPEWSGEEEALPVINEYYKTNCKTLREAFNTIGGLMHSDPMCLYEENQSDVEAVKAAKIK